MSATGTKSQVTHLPGPTGWVESHPARPLANPSDLSGRPGILFCLQTGWPLPPGGLEARGQMSGGHCTIDDGL